MPSLCDSAWKTGNFESQRHGYKDCFIGEKFPTAGSNCMAQAELAAEILEKRIALTGIELEVPY